MKLSAKSRYALAALVEMGLIYHKTQPITIAFLSEKLEISKIYLEQVFSLLKRGDVVTSTKGAGGGYQLAQAPECITVYNILASIESSLFEEADATVKKTASHIETVLQQDIFHPLDHAIFTTLRSITLAALVTKAQQYGEAGYMYYL